MERQDQEGGPEEEDAPDGKHICWWCWCWIDDYNDIKACSAKIKLKKLGKYFVFIKYSVPRSRPSSSPQINRILAGPSTSIAVGPIQFSRFSPPSDLVRPVKPMIKPQSHAWSSFCAGEGSKNASPDILMSSCWHQFRGRIRQRKIRISRYPVKFYVTPYRNFF